jgi:hypothetical protein
MLPRGSRHYINAKKHVFARFSSAAENLSQYRPLLKSHATRSWYRRGYLAILRPRVLNSTESGVRAQQGVATSRVSMPKANRMARATATVAFSSIIAILLALFGFLTGGYLRDRLGPPQADPDQMGSLGWGVLVGGAAALSGFAGCLFFFWPRANKPVQHSPDRSS